MEKYFKIYSNCILVKGIKRSVICDIQKQTFHIIPNTLYNILSKKKYNKKSIAQLYEKFNKNKSVLEEYFKFLIDENLIILAETKRTFKSLPKLSKAFSVSNTISNAIIDFNEEIYSYEKVIHQLDKLLCKDLMVRFFSEKNIGLLSNILESINCSDISNLELVLPYCSEINEINIQDIVKKSNKISKIYLHSLLENLESKIIDVKNAKVIFTKQKINSSECCGFISPEYFEVNNDMILQSLSYNSCLYKKIGIDEWGEIKNCPAMKKSFGNTKSTSLDAVIQKEEFKKLWYYKKNSIKVCKDCEFRHICSDCRAHIDNANDLKSKPLKCNYDPYTARWE